MEAKARNMDRLAVSLKRLQRVRARIDDYVPADKTAPVVSACADSQRLYDDLASKAQLYIPDDQFVKLDKSIETAERVFGFLEQVATWLCAINQGRTVLT